MDFMFKLDDCVTYIASNALKEIMDRFNEILQSKGSTRVQWIALYYIAQHEKINQSELSGIMNIKPPTMVRLIDRLEKEGLVTRTPDKESRRVMRLSCTDKGLALNEKMLPIGDAFSKAIAEGIPEKDLDCFTSVLSLLVKNLEGIDKKI